MRTLLLFVVCGVGGLMAAALVQNAVLGQERAKIERQVPFYDASPTDTGSLRIIKKGIRTYRTGKLEKFAVPGYIFNAGDFTVDVPDVRMELRDEANILVRETRTKVETTQLDPGKAIGFEISMEIPSLVDRSDLSERLTKGAYSYSVSLDP